ncbi:MAG: SLC13 family permease [Hyphomicrobiales bacterium]|nr:SLC13 family permease [Hyphomicrobiales bacterium]
MNQFLYLPENVYANLPMWLCFGIIIFAIISYAAEKISLEVTSLFVISAFLVLFHLFPVTMENGKILTSMDLLAGFANPALITILSLLVIGQALFQTGALDGVAQIVSRVGEKRPQFTIAMVFLIAGIVSAFLNNTPVVIMFLPIIIGLARKIKIAESRVAMSLSFISILGGMTTLIGSSSNLLASSIIEQKGLPAIKFFDFTVPALILASVGAVYVIFIMPQILKSNETKNGENAAVNTSSGKQFLAQIRLNQDNPLVGVHSRVGLFPELKNMTVRSINRGYQTILPPFEDVTLKIGDVVIVAATRGVLAQNFNDKNSFIRASFDNRTDGVGEFDPADVTLAESIVAPASRMIGQTINQSNNLAQTGCSVLGLQRRKHMVRQALDEVRLEAGDVLLLLGRRSDIFGMRTFRDLLVLEWSATDMPLLSHARRALIIFGITIGLAASGMVPIVITAFIGALAMIMTGALNIRQATRAIDRKIFLLIGAALAMSTALEAVGGATMIAHAVVSSLDGAPVWVILSCFFLLIAILTNFLSNHATAVLFAPIAYNTAIKLNIDPQIFIYTVIFAANCSFATPIAYQTNLLVMSPGNYKFFDFVKAGVPLVILMWITFTIAIPYYYGL